VVGPAALVHGAARRIADLAVLRAEAADRVEKVVLVADAGDVRRLFLFSCGSRRVRG
jgi:hypothetical protein